MVKFLIYIDQEFYKEDPDLYKNDLEEASVKLGIGIEDVAFITSDDEYNFLETLIKIDGVIWGEAFILNGCKMLLEYVEGGLITLFIDKKYSDHVKI